MPRYKVVDAPTYIDNNMRQPGEEVEYSGWPGSTLEPIDDEARRVKEYYGRHRGPRLSRRPDLSQFAEAMPVPPPKKTDHLFKSKKDVTDG